MFCNFQEEVNKDILLVIMVESWENVPCNWSSCKTFVDVVGLQIENFKDILTKVCIDADYN